MNNKILKSLERIELQNKTIWWDNVMIFEWIVSFFIISIGVITKNIFSIILGIVYFLLFTIIIQVSEKKELNSVRKYYEK